MRCCVVRGGAQSALRLVLLLLLLLLCSLAQDCFTSILPTATLMCSLPKHRPARSLSLLSRSHLVALSIVSPQLHIRCRVERSQASQRARVKATLPLGRPRCHTAAALLSCTGRPINICNAKRSVSSLRPDCANHDVWREAVSAKAPGNHVLVLCVACH